MSRIGRKPIVVPAGVKVAVNDGTVSVEGPKGKLSFTHRPEIGVAYDDASKQVLVTRDNDEPPEPGAARADAEPGQQHGGRRHDGLHEAARDRRGRLPGAD